MPLLGCISLCLVLYETAKSSPKVTIPVCIPTSKRQDFFLLHILVRNQDFLKNLFHECINFNVLYYCHYIINFDAYISQIYLVRAHLSSSSCFWHIFSIDKFLNRQPNELNSNNENTEEKGENPELLCCLKCLVFNKNSWDMKGNLKVWLLLGIKKRHYLSIKKPRYWIQGKRLQSSCYNYIQRSK